jgi:hypothetical protein
VRERIDAAQIAFRSLQQDTPRIRVFSGLELFQRIEDRV